MRARCGGWRASRRRGAAAGAVAWLVAILAGPAGVTAQETPAADRLFPSRTLLPDLLAGPRDPAMRGQLVYAWEDPTRYGAGVSGEVAVGGTLPLLLLAGQGGDDALVLGIEGGAFARFSFEVVERELVNTDWVFAVPLVWRRGGHWLRLRYYHTSSHLGDEYGRRFDEDGVNFSRDAVDATAFVRPTPALALYAIGAWAANVHPVESKRWLVRGGAEWDPWRGEVGRPYVALDIQAEEDTGWDPRLAAQAGLWLPSAQGRPFRLAVELLRGPSPLGQFHGLRTNQVALALIWNP